MYGSYQQQPINSQNYQQPQVPMYENIQSAINFAKQFSSPKEAFYALAKQRGVDPNVIINMLRSK